MTCNLKYTSLLLSLLAAFAACSDEWWDTKDPDAGKTMIELGVGGVDTDMLTRAVITDGTDKDMQNFDTNTKIFMIMKSEYSALSSPYDYLNYAGSQDPKYTVCRGDVTANDNKVVFDANNKKYWDDAHARSTKLNIWAYAQKGMQWTDCSFAVDKTGGGYESHKYNTSGKLEWGNTAIYPMIFSWKASYLAGADANKQNATTVMCQDLLFSNNLVNNTNTGTNLNGSDGRLAFNPSTRNFPTEGNAEMKFYHAMSKITIKINEGNGFDKTAATDFQFKSGTNVKLTGFNTEGLFSIQQGIFQQINAHADIPSIYLKPTSTTSAPYYTLEALAVPNIEEFMQTYDTPLHDDYSRFVKDAKSQATDVMMEFTIDNNTYRVTSGQLYDALHVEGDLVTNATEKNNNGTYIPLEAGKNYVFTFTIGKQAIDHITATVAEWEEVEATAQNLTNARVTIDIEDDRKDANAPNYAFYRLEDNVSSIPEDANIVANYNWETKYLSDTDHKCYLTHGTGGWSLTSDDAGENSVSWYWPNSMTYYHFRTVQPSDALINEDGTNGDYFTITSTFSDDTQYDPRWGAPFKEINQTQADKLIYNKVSGFDVDRNSTDVTDNPHQIYKAIGATTQAIKIIPIHMMSQVTFNITTSDGDDAVNLVNGTKQTIVELLQYYKEATVRLGSGLVSVSGSKTDAFEINQLSAPTDATHTATYFYSVVPQDLTNVELRITTPDNNRYLVPLKDVTSTSVSSNELVNPYNLADGKYKIDYWYPNYKYTYTFKLTKKGITDLKATIVDWETVTAGDETVQIQ